MPTYQYACKDCGRQFEIVQSFSDASLTECPECQGVLRKQYGAVGVIFKGSGFYRNDSRSKAKPGDSDTKPAAKKDEGTKAAAKDSSGSSGGSGSAGSGSNGSSSNGSGSTGASSTAATKVATPAS